MATCLKTCKLTFFYLLAQIFKKFNAFANFFVKFFQKISPRAKKKKPFGDKNPQMTPHFS